MIGIQRVLVVGAGAMGAQIAMVCARSGLEVGCHDIDAVRLDQAQRDVRARTSRDVEKGRLTGAEDDAAWGRIRFGDDLAALAADVDLVIEAAIEKIEVKREIFTQLDRLAPRHAILATNSSSFVPSRLADATDRPDLVCNLHFFNPALVMRCVEVVPGPATSAATLEAVTELVRRLGKTPVVLHREIPGFIANRILNAVRDEAISLLEQGVASVDAIDAACRTALGYPMGPFELMDLTGIDIGYHVKQSRYAETGDPADAPSKSVVELVERGDLGRKSGRGWYSYDPAGTKVAVVDRRNQRAHRDRAHQVEGPLR